MWGCDQTNMSESGSGSSSDHTLSESVTPLKVEMLPCFVSIRVRAKGSDYFLQTVWNQTTGKTKKWCKNEKLIPVNWSSTWTSVSSEGSFTPSITSKSRKLWTHTVKQQVTKLKLSEQSVRPFPRWWLFSTFQVTWGPVWESFHWQSLSVQITWEYSYTKAECVSLNSHINLQIWLSR